MCQDRELHGHKTPVPGTEFAVRTRAGYVSLVGGVVVARVKR